MIRKGLLILEFPDRPDDPTQRYRLPEVPNKSELAILRLLSNYLQMMRKEM